MTILKQKILITTEATSEEERVWLQSFHNQKNNYIKIFEHHFRSQFSLERIREILWEAAKELSEYNFRYQLSDEGILERHLISDLEKEDFFVAEESLGDEYIWDLEAQPPFKIYISGLQHEENCFFLRGWIHRILSQEDIEGKLLNSFHKLLNVEEPQISFAENLTYDDIENKSAQHILNVFQRILGVPSLKLDDNFFDCGGHSLLAIRAIAECRDNYGILIDFNHFFQAPTARKIAKLAVYDSAISDVETCTDVRVEEHLKAPLTFVQDFLWSAYKAFDWSHIYNLPFAVRFEKHVNEAVFKVAFEDVLTRHEGLRTKFIVDNNGCVMQHVIPMNELDEYKWFWHSEESREVSLRDEATYCFDLRRELPFRIRFIDDAKSQKQVLSFLVHHMVIDEWSLNTIMDDLKVAYKSRLNNKKTEWAQPATSIIEYALHQRVNPLKPEHRDYWRKNLSGVSTGLEIPKPALSQGAGVNMTEADSVSVPLATDLYSSLLLLAKRHSGSVFTMLYSAVVMTLFKAGHKKDLVVGTSASGRFEKKYMDTVGYFTTMVAHRIPFMREASVSDFLIEVSKTIASSMPYADVPINVIQSDLGLADLEGLLFDVYIHIHSHNSLNGFLLDGADGEILYQQVPPIKDTSMFALHYEFMDNVNALGQHELTLLLTYQKNMFTSATIEQLVKDFLLNIQLLRTQGGQIEEPLASWC